MQHLWFLEARRGHCAHQLDIPADEMRLRNYIRPEEFPYTTPNAASTTLATIQNAASGPGTDWLGELEKETGRRREPKDGRPHGDRDRPARTRGQMPVDV